MRRNSSLQWMVWFKLCLNFLFCVPVCSALWQPSAIGWAHSIIASYQKWQKNIRLSLLTQMLHYFHIDFALYQYCTESQCHPFHFYNGQFYICLNWIDKVMPSHISSGCNEMYFIEFSLSIGDRNVIRIIERCLVKLT